MMLYQGIEKVILTLTLLNVNHVRALGVDTGARDEVHVVGGAAEGGAVDVGEDVTDRLTASGLNGDVEVGAGEGHGVRVCDGGRKQQRATSRGAIYSSKGPTRLSRDHMHLL